MAPNAPELKQAELIDLVSIDATIELKKFYLKNKDVLNKTAEVALTLSDDIDQVHKGNFPRDIPEDRRRFSDFQLKIYDEQNAKNKIISEFNWPFIFNADSREPEIAGVGASLSGSFFTLIVCLILSFPLGILAAIYLEEFAPKNKITEIIEENERIVNDIFLSIIGQNQIQINQSSIIQLEYIASQCPLAGGNAVDAAIAAAMALTVVEPTGCGLGSDGFAIVWDGKELHGLNASGRSPAAWTPEYFGKLGGIPETGWNAVTVPGAVSAWVALSKRLGKLPFAQLAHLTRCAVAIGGVRMQSPAALAIGLQHRLECLPVHRALHRHLAT